MVASEATPWAKTGGLADVAGALPAALSGLGHDVVTVMPPLPRRRRHRRAVRHPLQIRSGSLDATVIAASRRGARDGTASSSSTPRHFRSAGLYGEAGRDYADNAERFALLSLAALEYAVSRMQDWPVDVVHAHDWQAGLVPPWLRADPARSARLSRDGHRDDDSQPRVPGTVPEGRRAGARPAVGRLHAGSRRVLGAVQLSQGRHHL